MKIGSLGVMLVAVALMTSPCIPCEAPVPGPSSAYLDAGDGFDVARKEFGKAVLAVREAEASGAEPIQLGLLVERLNLVVGMIGRAEQLVGRGEVEEAAVQLRRSVEVSREVVGKAAVLREEGARSTYYGRLLSFGMVPVASLLVTIISHFSWRWLRRREVERIMRSEIREGKGAREEQR